MNIDIKITGKIITWKFLLSFLQSPTFLNAIGSLHDALQKRSIPVHLCCYVICRFLYIIVQIAFYPSLFYLVSSRLSVIKFNNISSGRSVTFGRFTLLVYLQTCKLHILCIQVFSKNNKIVLTTFIHTLKLIPLTNNLIQIE